MQEENREKLTIVESDKKIEEKVYFFKRRSCSFFDQIDEIHNQLGHDAAIFYKEGEENIKAIVFPKR